MLFMRFNTSHVVIYLVIKSWHKCRCIVSIHLMLLFIRSHRRSTAETMQVSIHLMLLFISLIRATKFRFAKVSIHLMLLFIKEKSRKPVEKKNCFNTSHVVIYPTVLKHFFFSLFPFIPYFKAFSEILPAFFHFYIFLFIIAQPLVFTGFFRYFQFFQLVKFLQTNTYTLHLQFILSV